MNRLETIASLIPRYARMVVDVGYDHGQLIAMLVRRRPDIRVIGVERQVGAAHRFRRYQKLPSEAASRVRLVHGDGFEAIEDEAFDVAVMAGLGERRIVNILRTSEGTVLRLKRLIFAPLGNRAILRPYLRERSWKIIGERLLLEHGRHYPVFAAQHSERKVNVDLDTWLFGTGLFEQRHPLLPDYLAALARRLTPVLQHAADKSEDLQEFCAKLRPAIDLARSRCAVTAPTVPPA